MTQVRPAREQDAEALAALDRATWTTTTSPAPVPAPDQPFGDQDQRLADVLVAEQSGCPVGYVRVAQAVPLASHAHVLEVQGLAVDAAAQGQGTGRLLVEAAVRLARERGARKLSLRVLAPDSRARRLYEGCGQVEGVLRGEFLLDGDLVDDVLMARHLSA